jgi:nitrite reductase (NADH) small subunit
MSAVAKQEWAQVCTTLDLVEDSGVCALLNHGQVAIFYVPDSQPGIYALGNRDPIGKANVLSRGIVGDLGGALVVASPLYKQHFDLRTGVCLEQPDVAVPIYAARLDGDRVLIALPE